MDHDPQDEPRQRFERVYEAHYPAITRRALANLHRGSARRERLAERLRTSFTGASADARTGVPGSWYVHDGVLSGPGKAILLVGPTLKRPDAPGPVPLTHDRQGC